MPSAAKRRKIKEIKEPASISSISTASDILQSSIAVRSTALNEPESNRFTRARTPSSAWSTLNPPLSDWVLSAVASMGLTKMTPVQVSTIPLFMGNKDVVVEAVTGSGKTLAFLIPIVERLLRKMGENGTGESKDKWRKRGISAIVISPTRELASQIYSVLLSLLQFHGPSALAIPELSAAIELDHVDVEDQYSKKDEEAPITPPVPPAFGSRPIIIPQLVVGGTNRTPSKDLRAYLTLSPSILIGTPGRLSELLASQYIHCTPDSFEVLVLDEADRLLDLGFQDTLQRIIARLPKQRRTGLFSASVSDAVISSLIKTGLRNPVKILVKVQDKTIGEEKRMPASLDNYYIICPASHRLLFVQRLLTQNHPYFLLGNLPPPRKSIIYFSNCTSVDYFSSLLFPLLIPKSTSIIPLHGKQSPSTRAKNFNKFSTIASPVILVTTDLASRGLDIPNVDLVIQINPPTDPKVFLHRCGRAGRAGRRGLAILFLSPGREEEYIDFLAIRKTPISEFVFPKDSKSRTITNQEINDLVSKAQDVVTKDRSLYEKSIKSFVSHVRAYSKHQTSSIFRLSELNWPDLIIAYALIKIPKMPELRDVPASYLTLSLPAIDISLIPYKDPNQERKRLEELEKSKNPAMLAKMKEDGEIREAKVEKNSAWSGRKNKKDTKEERREKKRKKREVERNSKMTKEERKKEEEWKELVEEVRRRKVEVKKSQGKDKKDMEIEVDIAMGEEAAFKGFD